MFEDNPKRPEPYEKFGERPVPSWFHDAKLGIFMHWGPYAVPAWAEPAGTVEFGEDMDTFAFHNPYAEWYYNTSRIAGSPAAEHHHETYHDAPYDDFIDQWKAENFDATALLALVADSGARYFVPTTKHHDGVTLWDAPGTGGRNTVARGPRRDLVAELADATRAAGLRFGVYYSGGFDWYFAHSEPIRSMEDVLSKRPVDQRYSDYAFDQTLDLIRRFHPDVLWGDIDWPDAGKEPGAKSLVELFEAFYEASPEGVTNDRWGITHWDFRTSEYGMGSNIESLSSKWENTRGIGFSFGYNQLEDENTYLSGPDAIKLFVDIVSRGGNLLLNIGPKADGTVPELQARTLRELGEWNRTNGEAIFGSSSVDPTIAVGSDAPWTRWTATDHQLHAFVLPNDTRVPLQVDPTRINVESARLADGSSANVVLENGEVVAFAPRTGSLNPVRMTFAVRE